MVAKPSTKSGSFAISDSPPESGPPGASPRSPQKSVKRPASDKPRIGWREWVHLPELGGATIKAKVDTGARTSALHAWNIEIVTRNRVRFARFDLHPLQRSDRQIVSCEAPLLDRRSIRNSGGEAQIRPVVRTLIRIGHLTWPIELSLTSRDEMGFRMLLGRTAVRGRFLVDPGRSFLASRD